MSSAAQRPAWKILFIGGNFGTGKTMVARTLAAHFAIGLAEVDDFRLVLERATSMEQFPSLHRPLATIADMAASPNAVCDAMIAVARTVSHAMEILVANHVATDRPAIFEGEAIAPAFAAERDHAGYDVRDATRAVFLVEEDLARLFLSAVKRNPGFQQLPRRDQEHTIRVSWLYGRWLRQEATRFRLPVLVPRPWDTLEYRILGVIG